MYESVVDLDWVWAASANGCCGVELKLNGYAGDQGGAEKREGGDEGWRGESGCHEGSEESDCEEGGGEEDGCVESVGVRAQLKGEGIDV